MLLLLLIANVALGMLPSLAFFAWIERNSALPYAISSSLGWPWLDLARESVVARAGFDAFLVFAFGAIHTGLAQLPAQRALEKIAGPRGVRSLYMIATGLSVTAVMGFWQSTGVVLWVLPVSWNVLNAISFLVFWTWMAASGLVVLKLSAGEFVGISQLTAPRLRDVQTPKLVDSGIYGYVRHPVYLFTLLAMILTPFMTLDRFVVFAASLAYLVVAVPIEERKLVTLFGNDYLEYRKRVPAIFPKLKSI